MLVLSKLRLSVRILCISAFFLCSLAPIYVPERAMSEELESYEFMNDQFLQVEEGFVMKTASISEAGHRLAYSSGISHKVMPEESIYSIADLYKISVETIQWANDLSEGDVLHPGDTLIVLPVDGMLHTVSRGQSLSKIALLYDVPVQEIMEQNQLSTERIFAGQQVIIPGGAPITADRIAVVAAAGREGIEPAPPRPSAAPSAVPPSSHGVLQKPCDCGYTQMYHPGHYALDMASGGGSPIFAAEDGIVIRADYGWNGGYGNVIEIDHGNGLVTLYAHNKKLHVREGNAIRRGEVIASMGNTGRVYGRTGIHLHFEVILNGVKKNPLLYLQ